MSDSDELDLTVDGRPVTIWFVRIDGELYVRAYRGTRSRWFRRAIEAHEGRIELDGVEQDVTLVPSDDMNDAVDEAYRTKYRRSAYADDMTTDDVRSTTLKLVPR